MRQTDSLADERLIVIEDASRGCSDVILMSDK
jgi:hypothetical protein